MKKLVNVLRSQLVDFIEEYVAKDFSHDLDGTRRHVEQLVGQMMTTLANIRLARSVVDKVVYNFFSLLKQSITSYASLVRVVISVCQRWDPV